MKRSCDHGTHRDLLPVDPSRNVVLHAAHLQSEMVDGVRHAAKELMNILQEGALKGH